MNAGLVLQRGDRLYFTVLEELHGVREPDGVQGCPGLAPGWRGFLLDAGTLIPVYDPAPELPAAPLLVCADRDGMRYAIAAERIERVNEAPPEAEQLSSLAARLLPD